MLALFEPDQHSRIKLSPKLARSVSCVRGRVALARQHVADRRHRTPFQCAIGLVAFSILPHLAIAQTLPPPSPFAPGDVSPTTNTDVSTMVHTGNGYDAWTGAVHRVVIDLDVPGAVSSHGLKVIRTYSSSTGIGWSLSWQWQMHFHPFGTDYLVSMPDGRALRFTRRAPNLIALRSALKSGST